MTRSEVRSINAELEKVLAKFGKKHDMAFNIKSCRFDDTGMRYTIESAVLSEDAGDGEEALFEREARKVRGLNGSEYGETFKNRNSIFTIVGCNGRAKKYPLIAENRNGTRYKFPLSVLK